MTLTNIFQYKVIHTKDINDQIAKTL